MQTDFTVKLSAEEIAIAIMNYIDKKVPEGLVADPSTLMLHEGQRGEPEGVSIKLKI